MTDNEIDLELERKRLDWGLSLPDYKAGNYEVSEPGDLIWVVDECHANDGYWYRMKNGGVKYRPPQIVVRRLSEEVIDDNPVNRPGWSDWS